MPKSKEPHVLPPFGSPEFVKMWEDHANLLSEKSRWIPDCVIARSHRDIKTHCEVMQLIENNRIRNTRITKRCLVKNLG